MNFTKLLDEAAKAEAIKPKAEKHLRKVNSTLVKGFRVKHGKCLTFTKGPSKIDLNDSSITVHGWKYRMVAMGREFLKDSADLIQQGIITPFDSMGTVYREPVSKADCFLKQTRDMKILAEGMEDVRKVGFKGVPVDIKGMTYHFVMISDARLEKESDLVERGVIIPLNQ